MTHYESILKTVPKMPSVLFKCDDCKIFPCHRDLVEQTLFIFLFYQLLFMEKNMTQITLVIT